MTTFKCLLVLLAVTAMAIAYPRRHEEDRAPPEWLQEVLTHEELQKMRDLRAARDWDAIKTMVAEALEELPEDRRRAIATFRGRRETEEEEAAPDTEELPTWLSDEQKAEITELKAGGADWIAVKAKIMAFFDQLPEEQQKTLNAKYKKMCARWVKKVASEEEQAELKELHAQSDFDALKQKLSEYKERLEAPLKAKVEQWEDVCMELWEMDKIDKETYFRLRRSLGDDYKEWIAWLTDEQRAELKTLKDGGASNDELKDKVKEYFDALGEEQKATVKTTLKEKCVGWIREVATDDEEAELKENFDDGDKDAIKTKVEEYFGRLSAERQAQVAPYRPICRELWALKEPTLRKRRNLDSHYAEWLSWMTDAQKEEVKALKEGGASVDELKTKVKEIFATLPADRQTELKTEFKGKCADFIKKIATPEEVNELKTLHGAGNEDGADALVNTIVSRLEGETKEKAEKMKSICHDLYHEGHSHDGHSHHRRSLDEALEKYLGWLTPEQKEELKELKAGGSSFDELKNKVLEFYEALEGDKKNEVSAKLKTSCTAWIKTVANDEEVAEIERLHESGDHESCKSKVAEYFERLPADKKEKVSKYRDICEKIWYGSHDHHDHGLRTRRQYDDENDENDDDEADEMDEDRRVRRYDNDENEKTDIADSDEDDSDGRVRRNQPKDKPDYKQFITWLTPEQKAELLALKEKNAGWPELRDKIWQYYEAAEGEVKTKATEKLQEACRLFVKYVVGDEKAQELKNLKENGATNQELSTKIDEMINNIEDEDKKSKAEVLATQCKKVHGLSESRRRRNHEDQSHALFEEYLQWLTEEQRAELRAMKDNGSDLKDLKAKVYEYFQALPEDRQTELKTSYKAKCVEWIKEVATEDEQNELKALLHANDKVAMKAKADALFEKLPEEKRAKLAHFRGICKRLWGVEVTGRLRRDSTAEPTHDHSDWRKYLDWLTPEQTAELKALKEGGADYSDLRDKLIEYYEALEGDIKEAAKETLKKGCVSWVKKVASEEEQAELKQLHSSNDQAALETKVQELVGRLDPKYQEKVEQVRGICKKLWGVESETASTETRRRRDGDNKQDYMQYMSWLSDDQKAEIASLKAAGASYSDMRDKVWEFYEALEGDAKTAAKEQLKGACGVFVKHIVKDQAKIDELKSLKDAGDKEAIKSKIDEIINAMEDGPQKERAQTVRADCQRLFEVAEARFKRGKGKKEGKSAKWMKFLTWMTNDQKNSLKALKDSGASPSQLVAEVKRSYESISDTNQREQAKRKLKSACSVLIKKVATPEQANQLKQLKEEGDNQQLKSLIDTIIARLAGTEREAAYAVKDECLRLHNLGERRRRHEGQGDAWKAHLTWLTQEQKDELKALKEGGADFDTMKNKVWEFYEAATGEVKTEATSHLKQACREFIKKAVGEEKAAELKALNDGGATKEELSAKADELIASLENADMKKKAEAVAQSCKVVFGVASKRMRRGEGHGDAWKSYLTWLTQEQKDEIKVLKEGGADFDTLKKKVWEYYEAASGDVKTEATTKLQDACRGFIKKSVGDEKAAELKALKESGATNEVMVAKVDELIEGIADADHKAKAQAVAQSCKVVFGVASRKMRRHEGHHDAWKSYLTWLTQEQKDELKTLKEGGADFDTLKKKVWEFYEAATGEVKTEATTKLQDACRGFIKKSVGDEKAAELKTLKESGATNEAMVAKVDELINSLGDPEMKAKAQAVADSCKVVFGVSSRRLRRNHANHEGHDDHEDHDHHDNWTKKYLNWLTQEQKDELKALKEGGATHESLRDKVMEYFEAAEGDVKKDAVTKMKEGCTAMMVAVVGQEKTDELKALKEGGATHSEMEAKANEFVGEVTDAHKKEMAGRYLGTCKKVYSSSANSRRRRNHPHEHEAWVNKYLSWMTEEQRAELKTLKESGASQDEMRSKVLAAYEATEGDKRTQATELLQSACRELLVSVVGPEKAAELKALKDGGATKDELSAKADEFLAEVTDEDKKTKVEHYGSSCKKIFAATSRRMRRNEDEKHANFVKEYLSWLTPEQQQELKDLRASGASKQNIKDKVMEYYNAADGDVKAEATTKLQGACRSLIVSMVGAEKAEELKTLKESGASKEALAEKVNELIAAIEDEDKKAQANEYSDTCRHIFGVAGRRRRAEVAESDVAKAHEAWAKKYLSWLTPEQIAELRTMHGNAASHEAIRDKIDEYFEAAEGDVKKEATEKLQDACRALIVKTVGAEKAAELKALKDGGATKDEIAAKVSELISGVEDESKKVEAERYKDSCQRIFEASTSSRLRRDQHDAKHEEWAQKYLSWLTDEQRQELKALHEANDDHDQVRDKVIEFFEAAVGEVKAKATTELQSACRALIVSVMGPDQATELRQLKENGASKEELSAKAAEFIAAIQDPAKKTRAEQFSQTCKKIFGVTASRLRRGGGHHYDAWKEHLTWLTQEQKDELKSLKEGGADFDTLKNKVWEFYEASTGEVKTEATTKLQDACRHFIKKMVGDEKAQELKTLKESGASNDEIVAKVDTLIAGMEDEDKKKKAEAVAQSCKVVFGVSSKRMRRGEGHGDAWKSYLTWLTQEQKDEIKALKEGGADFDTLKKKVWEYYEAASGDVKTEATTKLQDACRGFIKKSVGDEKAAELKALKESGATNEVMVAKVDELIEGIADADHKAKAQAVAQSCKVVFGVASRKMRRHEGHHDAWKSYLTWLTQEQKDELKTLKEGGADFDTLKKKVWEFYEAATGEVKTEATTKLQDACRGFIKKSVGDEKAAELKTLKESGASNADMVAKVDELINSLEDPEMKAKAQAVADSCKVVFGVSSRRLRRNHANHEGHDDHEDHDHHDNWTKKYLNWLTQEQKDELKALKEGGATHESLRDKVMEYFEAAEGDVKKDAVTKMKEGCTAMMVAVVGQEKTDELKALKEGGATHAEMEAKANEFVGEVTDAHKKEMAGRYLGSCKKVYSASGNSRMRRGEGHGDAWNSYLTWLTQEQKDELKALKEGGADFDTLKKKVWEFYEAATGEVKTEATTKLQDACRGFIKKSVGDEKAAELKALKESGATNEAMVAKVDELINSLEDPEMKAKAQAVADSCKVVFGVSSSRLRRHEGQGDAWKAHLTWLTQEQKDELKALKEGGADFDTMKNKVWEFYEAATGEVKTEATSHLKQACREFIKKAVGEEKAAELKALNDGGATKEELSAKADELIASLENADMKKKAEAVAQSCKVVFGVASRKMRRHEGHHDAWKSYLTWLTQEQKDELKTLKEGGADFDTLKKKVWEFYEAATGEVKTEATTKLQDACRGFIKKSVGDEKAAELKTLKESGATNEAMVAKVDELINSLEDPEMKAKAQAVADSCKVVFGVSSKRMRRGEGHGDAWKSYLTWLTQEQKDEIKALKEGGADFDTLKKKVWEYYEAASGDVKTEATTKLQDACRGFIKKSVGDEKAAELKALKESGASNADIVAKVDELIEGIADADHKAKAQAVADSCKVVFGVNSRRIRENYDHLKEHLDWLEPAQKAALKELKESGASKDQLKAKVMMFFAELPADKQEELKTQWKGKCISWVKDVASQEERDELKQLHEEKKWADLKAKIEVYIDRLDENMKQKVLAAREVCQKLFHVGEHRF